MPKNTKRKGRTPATPPQEESEKEQFYQELRAQLPPADGVPLQDQLNRAVDEAIREKAAAKKRKLDRLKRQHHDPPAPTLSPDAPFWLPAGHHYENLPAGTKWAIQNILTPAYRQLVLQAPDELERAAGLSLVHVMWMEIRDQSDLGQIVADTDWLMSVANDRADKISAHLNLVAAKSNLAQLLGRLRAIRRFFEQNHANLIPAATLPAPIEVLSAPPKPDSPPS